MSPNRPDTALLWADVSEFTLAMESNERHMAERTVAWVERCVQGWLAVLGGEFLQQAGDAVLLAFGDAERALQAARRLQQDWAQLAPMGTGHRHELRIALHWGRVWGGPRGYVSHSLNQLARLAQQVVAGQVWGSEAFYRRLPTEARRHAVPLGWMHFKHLARPLQVFELAVQPAPTRPAAKLEAPAKPRLLVDGGALRGDWHPDDWAGAWVRHLDALGKFDVAALARWHPGSLGAQGLHASGADYVLTRRLAGRRARVELLATPHGRAIMAWDDADFDPHGPAVHARVAEVAEALHTHSLSLARSQPTGAMSPGLLRSAALGLMHGGNLHDFGRADTWLQAWQGRYARSPQPPVWRTLWQVMRHTRGLGGANAERALGHAQHALRLHPEHGHAWAARGFALAHLQGDLEGGMRDLEQAQAHAPDLHWVRLYRSALWCMLDEPQQALDEARLALAQSPSDELQGYALGVAGHAALFAGQPRLASQWLEDSWRQHRFHSPTLRMLVAAHQMLGQESVARLFMRELMVLEPGLTARTYLGRTRAGHARRAELAHWLIEAGLPLK